MKQNRDTVKICGEVTSHGQTELDNLEHELQLLQKLQDHDKRCKEDYELRMLVEKARSEKDVIAPPGIVSVAIDIFLLATAIILGLKLMS